MKSYRRFFYMMLAIVLLSSFVSLVSPICLQIWGQMDISLDGSRIVMLIGILIASNMLNILLIVYRERFAKNYNKRNFVAMISDFLHMDYDAIIAEGPSNMLEKIVTSTNQIYTYMTGIHIQIWASVVTAVVSVGLFCSVSLFWGAVMLLYVPVSYFGYKLLNKELAVRARKMQEETGKGFQEMMSYLAEPDYYKQLPDYEEMLERMLPAAERIYGSMARVNEFAQSVSSALDGLGTIFRSTIMMLIIYSFYQDQVSPFFLMMATIILPLYFSAVSTITKSNIQKMDYTVAKDLHNKIVQNAESETGETLGTVNSLEIHVSQLNVAGYTLSFFADAILHKGDIGQILGASGTGKSTFAKSLVRFRDVEGVQINGRDIAEYSLPSLRCKVEYISQNIPIINGTLLDNICFGKKSDVTEQQLKDNPYLETLFTSKTLDTPILEGGANLSGGEKQKIAIVRALLNKPQILILDEVCSNIDAETSDKIYWMLHAGREERITLIITHDRLPEGLVNVAINQGEKCNCIC